MSDRDTVTLTRAEYAALMERLEDAEDAQALAAHRARVKEIGEDAALAGCLPIELVRRMIEGEHPLRIWREHRGLSGQQLAAKSGVSQPYISDIELRKKPGSVDAFAKLAKALNVKIDDLVDDRKAA
jgi:ribosome-binding protein aMBF1 (putative translation factor)